jgi:hypothetical protein
VDRVGIEPTTSSMPGSSIFWRSWVTGASFFCDLTRFLLQSTTNCRSANTR